MCKELSQEEEHEFLKTRIHDISKAIGKDPRQQKYLTDDLDYFEDALWKVEHDKTMRTATRKIRQFLKVNPNSKKSNKPKSNQL